MIKNKRKNCLPGIDGGLKMPKSMVKGGKFPGSSAFQMNETALSITEKQRDNLPDEVVEAIIAKEQREGDRSSTKMTQAPMNFIPAAAMGAIGAVKGIKKLFG
jgi:hypothetical protein